MSAVVRFAILASTTLALGSFASAPTRAASPFEAVPEVAQPVDALAGASNPVPPASNTALSTSPSPTSTTTADPASLGELVSSAVKAADPMDPELECMAKAVHHEAANQSLKGQLAVAQLLLNRTRSTYFPKTICEVVNQKGQFFRIKGYSATKDAHRWAVAVAIARIARAEQVAQVVPGALFFHADYVKPSWSHKRTKVAQIGAHIFYR